MNNHRRYYAVRIGREGPRIYDNYAEFAAATLGLSGSSGKGFDNIHDAQEWLMGFQFGLTPGVTTIHTNINVNLNVSGGANINVGTSTPTPTLTVPQQAFPNYNPGLNQMQEVPRQRVEVKEEPAIELSDEQKSILKLVKSGRNIFFTGPAGTGKSVLLRAIISYLHSVHGLSIGVTAPTGIAGLNIGGQTIHSWAGIGLGKEPLEKLSSRLSGYATKRWKQAKALCRCWTGVYSTN
ncbi:hypothetical protein OG21DRAFT_306893 [Imleria badia]|nr:hypothetical protein OG21DRAFT_306893 [Imleria badia]